MLTRKDGEAMAAVASEVVRNQTEVFHARHDAAHEDKSIREGSSGRTQVGEQMLDASHGVKALDGNHDKERWMNRAFKFKLTRISFRLCMIFALYQNCLFEKSCAMRQSSFFRKN
jgi:hypothetical protein